MIDELLATLPAIITSTGEKAWLTIGSGDGFWQAAYLNEDGEPVSSFYGQGATAAEALQALIEAIKLLDLLMRPAVRVDELTGKELPPTQSEA